jgi:hypothetical protein
VRASPAEALSAVAAAAAPHGLRLLGSFACRPSDSVPERAPKAPTAGVALLGNAGPDLWQAFAAQRRGEPHPLDAWTRRAAAAIVAALAGRFDRPRAVFPFEGPPYMPFQRWALRSGEVAQSPIGLLIHREYGLWHAYRCAILLDSPLPGPAGPAVRPCDSCADRPCLGTCPVDAFAPGLPEPAPYDVARCRDHVRAAAGTDCRTQGCRARRACPVGRAYVYGNDQAAFHMAAFMGSTRVA